MKNIFWQDNKFYSQLAKLAIPVTIQHLITSSLNMVDSVMVGQLGTSEIAAVGLANKLFFVLMVVLSGISSGASIFTAQFWGKKDHYNVRRTVGVSLFFSVFVSLIATLIAVTFPEYMLGIFSEDAVVINMGSEYLRTVSISYVFTALTFIYSFTLRSTQNVKVPMFISGAAIGLNTLFNYALIFGNFGFPAMGVKGAAAATCIARIIECTLLLVVTYAGKYPVAAGIRHITGMDFNLVKKLCKTSAPLVVNEFIWGIGVTVYSIVYGRMGTGEIAAIQIALPMEHISIELFIGLSSAAAIMIGNKIGAGEEEEAYSYSRRFMILGPVLALGVGAIMLAGSNMLLSIYNVSDDTGRYAGRIIIIMSVFLWVKVFNMITAGGILRSGGDTKYTLFLDILGVWFIGIPLALLGGFVFGLPVYWVYALATIEEIVRLILGLKRIYSRKWINNLVNVIN